MADIEWIKLRVDMPDDEKIKIIDTMPDRDAIWVIFIKLLLQAGRCNAGGMVYVEENLPFSDESLAAVFNRPLNTVRLALKVLAELRIIEVHVTGEIFINQFSKHQNVEGMARVRQLGAERVRRFRENKKLLAQNTGSKDDVTLPVTFRNAIDIDKELDKEVEVRERLEETADALLNIFDEIKNLEYQIENQPMTNPNKKHREFLITQLHMYADNIVSGGDEEGVYSFLESVKQTTKTPYAWMKKGAK